MVVTAKLCRIRSDLFLWIRLNDDDLFLISTAGQNFKDYPDGSQLILVDINDKFFPAVRDNLAKFPALTLEKYYVTDAADMHEIPDGSVDAVVTQYALCSCHEVLQIMKEIKRILAPVSLW